MGASGYLAMVRRRRKDMLDMEKNYKLAGYIWSFVKVDKNHAVIQSHGVTA